MTVAHSNPSDPRLTSPQPIEAITPRGQGHHFVFYGDACSGVADALHAHTFADINAVVARVTPRPEFVIFPGDEVIGLTAYEEVLRAQWRYWLDVEMAWLDRQAIPLYHTTSNHTTYDAMSERLFREALAYLPRNGPPGQEGLSYFVRRDDLLLVFVNTCSVELGGEGHVETVWLAQTLQAHADARYKLVIGHHPVFPANWYVGPYQREIGAEYVEPFWRILVGQGVFAYLCSHMLAFDVQVHEGVLQIMSAGAGTAHRLPEGIEYLHAVQGALDAQGLRYQVLDDAGHVRERLSWPLRLPAYESWALLELGEQAARFQGYLQDDLDNPQLMVWRLAGRTADGWRAPQTILCAHSADATLPALWMGLTGPQQRLTVRVGRERGRSPLTWFGPLLTPGAPFDVQIALHVGMGPGGFLWRWDDQTPWSSLQSVAPWGAERLLWPAHWCVGFGQGGRADSPFVGHDLAVSVLIPALTPA